MQMQMQMQMQMRPMRPWLVRALATEAYRVEFWS